jgi:hypothetical protein
VIAKRDAKVRSTREGVTSAAGMDVAPLSKFLAEQGVILQLLFGVSEEDLLAEAAAMAPEESGRFRGVKFEAIRLGGRA